MVAVFYALLVGFFVYKELTFKKLLKVAVDSIISAAITWRWLRQHLRLS